MPSSLIHSPLAQPNAARVAVACARQLEAVGYYFFGYWFSHRRA